MPAVYWFGMFSPTAFLLLCACVGGYTEFFGKELSLRLLPYYLFPSIAVSCWILFEISWEYRNSMMYSKHFRYWFDLAVMLVAAGLYPVYLAVAFFLRTIAHNFKRRITNNDLTSRGTSRSSSHLFKKPGSRLRMTTWFLLPTVSPRPSAKSSHTTLLGQSFARLPLLSTLLVATPCCRTSLALEFVVRFRDAGSFSRVLADARRHDRRC